MSPGPERPAWEWTTPLKWQDSQLCVPCYQRREGTINRYGPDLEFPWESAGHRDLEEKPGRDGGWECGNRWPEVQMDEVSGLPEAQLRGLPGVSHVGGFVHSHSKVEARFCVL